MFCPNNQALRIPRVLLSYFPTLFSRLKDSQLSNMVLQSLLGFSGWPFVPQILYAFQILKVSEASSRQAASVYSTEWVVLEGSAGRTLGCGDVGGSVQVLMKHISQRGSQVICLYQQENKDHSWSHLLSYVVLGWENSNPPTPPPHLSNCVDLTPYAAASSAPAFGKF